MEAFFDFEKPIISLEKNLQELRNLAQQNGMDYTNEIRVLEAKVHQLIDDTYLKLTPWQRVQLSRHPSRPYTDDYIEQIFPDFMELQGDRCFGDDAAIVGGVATLQLPSAPLRSGKASKGSKAGKPEDLRTTPVLLIGHRKGRTTKQKMQRNFGMARPEGYRKAMRLMELANRSGMPIITFIDTPGAYPGIEAEERGQSQAIAESIRTMFGLTVPVLCIVLGEGGSGGALAIGIGNQVLMLEYSTYSVISPESCASILWSDSSLAERASEKLKMNPTELLRFGVIDGIIGEPKGGAHRDRALAAQTVRNEILSRLPGLLDLWQKNPKELQAERMRKFRAMGQFSLGHAPL